MLELSDSQVAARTALHVLNKESDTYRYRVLLARTILSDVCPPDVSPQDLDRKTTMKTLTETRLYALMEHYQAYLNSSDSSYDIDEDIRTGACGIEIGFILDALEQLYIAWKDEGIEIQEDIPF